MIELLNIDCMEYMKGLEDNHFDICITSPPYNMNLRVNSKGDGYCSRQVVKEISSKYENFSDNLPMDDYQRFLEEFLSEACRVSGLVFFNIMQITGNKPALYKAIGNMADQLKETIIWDKIATSPAVNHETLNSQFEFIFVFGGRPITRQFLGASNFERGSVSNVWKIPSRKTQSEAHGAGFPVAIPNNILALFGFDGCKGFDPFSGTGTTAIASHYAGHDFVGCEIDKDYHEAAQSRFNIETSQINLL